MNNSKFSPLERVTPQAHPALYWTLADALVLAKRQLMQIPRVPDELVTATLQPAIIVLVFSTMFGGAITVPGGSYINYLMAGVFVQSIIFGSATTGVGVATDLQRGVIDRFRSLPMAQSAVLTGRIFADLIRSILIILVTWVVGLLVGFRPEGTLLAWIAATGLLLLISFVLSWISALVGLLLNSVEAVQQAGLIWLIPFVFGSSVFVPLETLPDWLRVFAEHQPVSLMMDAVRGLLLNQIDAATIARALVWCIVLLVIFIPLAVWAYGRRTAR